MERLASRRLTGCIKASGFLPPLQSGFRQSFSTETTVLKVLSDLLAAGDRGDVGVLVLLDLSAALNTVDHMIMLKRPERTFRVSGVALDWPSSYLVGREQFVRLGADSPGTVTLPSGLPLGSVLGPLLFIMYTVDLIDVILSNHLLPHLYADDTQLYGSSGPEDVSTLAARVTGCVKVVAEWMRSNRLQINADKTEVLWVVSTRQQHQLPLEPLIVDSQLVAPVRSVMNLGVFINSDLVMRTLVAQVVSRGFAMLRQLRQVRRSLPATTIQTLVVALVLNRLDYANGALAGLPTYLIRRLQSVFNASARLI
jgi:Reverse transcriptase (RNA-dependent DNA polymerase)